MLILEDDPLLGHHLSCQLSELGNQIHWAKTAEEGLFMAKNFPNDIAIVDLGLPDFDGLRIKEIRRADIPMPILILTVVPIGRIKFLV